MAALHSVIQHAQSFVAGFGRDTVFIVRHVGKVLHVPPAAALLHATIAGAAGFVAAALVLASRRPSAPSLDRLVSQLIARPDSILQQPELLIVWPLVSIVLFTILLSAGFGGVGRGIAVTFALTWRAAFAAVLAYVVGFLALAFMQNVPVSVVARHAYTGQIFQYSVFWVYFGVVWLMAFVVLFAHWRDR